jgi:lipopolysaccharide biosynthesis protein
LTPNRGRDILPFLLALRVIDLSRYSHFLKIHTKRSQHLHDRGRWFHNCIRLLAGSKAMTDRLFEHIDPDRCLIYGPEAASLEDHLENNRLWLTHLFRKPPEEVRGMFSPGTMCAGSGTFLRLLKEKNLHLLPAEDERGQLDGCLPHALERYFGYFAAANGGEYAALRTLAERGEPL